MPYDSFSFLYLEVCRSSSSLVQRTDFIEKRRVLPKTDATTCASLVNAAGMSLLPFRHIPEALPVW